MNDVSNKKSTRHALGKGPNGNPNAQREGEIRREDEIRIDSQAEISDPNYYQSIFNGFEYPGGYGNSGVGNKILEWVNLLEV